jgi:hypothetical protein
MSGIDPTPNRGSALAKPPVIIKDRVFDIVQPIYFLEEIPDTSFHHTAAIDDVAMAKPATARPR